MSKHHNLYYIICIMQFAQKTPLKRRLFFTLRIYATHIHLKCPHGGCSYRFSAVKCSAIWHIYNGITRKVVSMIKHVNKWTNERKQKEPCYRVYTESANGRRREYVYLEKDLPKTVLDIVLNGECYEVRHFDNGAKLERFRKRGF